MRRIPVDPGAGSARMQFMLEGLRHFLYTKATRRRMNRLFSRKVDPYRYASSPYENERFTVIEAYLKARPAGHVLELGCAEGVFTERLAPLAERITALDVSKVALKRARERLANQSHVQFVESDLFRWIPPSPASFDAVVCSDVIYYLNERIVHKGFQVMYPRIASWMALGGILILANGFVGEEEKRDRMKYRIAFEGEGLELVDETVVTHEDKGSLSCLVSVLKRLV